MEQYTVNQNDQHRHDQQAYVAAVEEYRMQKDDVFRDAPDSPIPDDERETFSGLAYFPPELAFRVKATLTPFRDPQIVRLGSTKGDLRPQLRYGELAFRLGGVECRLIAFKDAGDPDGVEMFVPFRDSTTGHETYGAGRYVEPHDTGSGTTEPRTVLVDFNLAYSPYCAYDVRYSCTLPPPENALPVAVTAGEKTYGAGH